VLERVVVGRERFAWGLTLHVRMIAQLDRCRSTGTGEFAFGSILVAWFLERVPMLRPRVLLEAPGAREPRLRRWSSVLVRHGGGEGGHYFTAQAAQIWRQMPQVILRYPYAGVDFRGDPDMVLPPGEVFDHRGMLSFVYVLIYVVILIYQFIFMMIDTDMIVCWLFCACADLAPRGREVEFQRAPAQRELERPPRGGRRRRDEAAGAPAEPERPARRRRFDDPGAGPSHAPPAAAGGDFDDIRRRLETVLQDVPEGMWICIQDEGFLEQCIGLPPPWRSIVRRAAVLAAMTSGRLPPGQEGPAGVPPPPPGAGGGGPPPPPEGGAAGGAIEAP
jgi:hypothetical protein